MHATLITSSTISAGSLGAYCIPLPVTGFGPTDGPAFKIHIAQILQNQIHFLRQTYGNRPLDHYRKIYPSFRPLHCKLVSTGHMNSGKLSYVTDDDHYSESSGYYSTRRAANFSFTSPRCSLDAGNAVGFGVHIRWTALPFCLLIFRTVCLIQAMAM